MAPEGAQVMMPLGALKLSLAVAQPAGCLGVAAAAFSCLEQLLGSGEEPPGAGSRQPADDAP